METTRSRNTRRWGRRATVAAVGAAFVGVMGTAGAAADPIWPGGPDIPGVPQLITLPGAPTISPGIGQTVGGKRPIDVFFAVPVADRGATERSIAITPSTPVAGHFKWIDNRHVQWAPNDYWPRGTNVTVNMPGANSAFKVSDQFTGIADGAAHTFTVKIGDDVVKVMPASLGSMKHRSPDGSFRVLERNASVIMDSSTYGVPVNSAEGYRVNVAYATRITWDGIYVHAAPWSVAQQGNSNVSHGCINVSTENAKWYYENVRLGDAVSIVNA